MNKSYREHDSWNRCNQCELVTFFKCKIAILFLVWRKFCSQYFSCILIWISIREIPTRNKAERKQFVNLDDKKISYSLIGQFYFGTKTSPSPTHDPKNKFWFILAISTRTSSNNIFFLIYCMTLEVQYIKSSWRKSPFLYWLIYYFSINYTSSLIIWNSELTIVFLFLLTSLREQCNGINCREQVVHSKLKNWCLISPKFVE